MPTSFIDSGFTSRVEYDKWLASGASEGGSDLVVRGMSISHNVIAGAMLAKEAGGKFEVMNIMEGAHMAPAMLAINPWHQMPNMTDGTVKIAESGAIVRYIANKYFPEKYGGSDPAAKATIDWALEWMSTNFGRNDFVALWYGVTGFGPPPEDQAAANVKALANLELFATQFLTGPGPFVGGAATPSIADYVCASKFHCVGDPTIKAKIGFEVCARPHASHRTRRARARKARGPKLTLPTPLWDLRAQLPPKIASYEAAFFAITPQADFIKEHDGFMSTKM